MAIRVLRFQAASGDAAIQYTAQDDRTLVDALVYILGVSWRDDYAVTQRAAGANFSVDVAGGHAIVAGTSVTDQGKYVVQNDATVNLAIASGGSATARYDLVYLRVRDKPADGLGFYDAVIDKITGTVGAGVPTLSGAGITSAIALAEVGPITTSTASITNALINDVRVRARAVDDPTYVLSVVESGTHSNASTSTRVNVIPQQTFRVTGDSTWHRYLFTVNGHRLSGATGGELGRLILNVDGTEVKDAQWYSPSAGAAGEVSAGIHEWPIQMGAGLHTVKVDVLRVVGGSSVTTDSTHLLVKKVLAT